MDQGASIFYCKRREVATDEVDSCTSHWKDDVIYHLIISFSVKHEMNSSAETERKTCERLEERGENVKQWCENTKVNILEGC